MKFPPSPLTKSRMMPLNPRSVSSEFLYYFSSRSSTGHIDHCPSFYFVSAANHTLQSYNRQRRLQSPISLEQANPFTPSVYIETLGLRCIPSHNSNLRAYQVDSSLSIQPLLPLVRLTGWFPGWGALLSSTLRCLCIVRSISAMEFQRPLLMNNFGFGCICYLLTIHTNQMSAHNHSRNQWIDKPATRQLAITILARVITAFMTPNNQYWSISHAPRQAIKQ